MGLPLAACCCWVLELRVACADLPALPGLPPHPAGLTPFWPNALAGLTGLNDGEGSELSEAAARLEPLLQQ